MENKYYTPEIEEFHIGFEYEIKIGGNDLLPIDGPEWLQVRYPDPFIGESIGRIKNLSGFRVKYLDQEDIESLGWSFKSPYNFNIKNWELSIDVEDYEIDIYYNMETNKSIHFFTGIIKNKSELKRLMKQLNIE